MQKEVRHALFLFLLDRDLAAPQGLGCTFPANAKITEPDHLCFLLLEVTRRGLFLPPPCLYSAFYLVSPPVFTKLACNQFVAVFVKLIYLSLSVGSTEKTSKTH